MKNTTREALSAILDGEGSEFEIRRTLAGLDPDDAASFGRWQLAQDVIHGQAVAPVSRDFSSLVQAAIAGEKQESAQGGKGLLLARVAVVATVAFSTLFGIQYWVGSGQSVDHFTALSAPEQRLADFAGDVSPVSKPLEAPATTSATVKDDAVLLQQDDTAGGGETAGQILE